MMVCRAYSRQSFPLNHYSKATFTQNLLLFIHLFLLLLLFTSMTGKTNILFFQPCALMRRKTEIVLIFLCGVEVFQLILCGCGLRHSPVSHYGQPINHKVGRFAIALQKNVYSSNYGWSKVASAQMCKSPSTSLCQRGSGSKYASLITMAVSVPVCTSLTSIWPVSFWKSVSWCDSSRQPDSSHTICMAGPS